MRDFHTRSARMPGPGENQTGEAGNKSNYGQQSRLASCLADDIPLDYSGVTGTAMRDFHTRSARMPGPGENQTGEAGNKSNCGQQSRLASYLAADIPLDYSGVTGTAMRDFHTRSARMPGPGENQTGEAGNKSNYGQQSRLESCLADDIPLDYSGVTGTAMRDFHTRSARMPGPGENQTGEAGNKSNCGQQSRLASYLADDIPLDYSGVTGTSMRDFHTRSARMPGPGENQTGEAGNKSNYGQQSRLASYLADDIPLDYSGVTGTAMRDFHTRSARMPGPGENQTWEAGNKSNCGQQSRLASYLADDIPLDYSGVTGTARRDVHTRSARMPGPGENQAGEAGEAGEASNKSNYGQQSGLMTVRLPNSRNNNQYECNFCHKIFSRQRLLTRHKRAHGKEAQCPVCFKRCKNSQSLRSHVDEQHKEKTTAYVCNYCQKKFRFLCRLEQHCAVHIDNKSFQCESCSMCFYIKEKLQKHIDTVHRSKNDCGHKCNECGKIFNSGHSLHTHRSKMHRTKHHVKCKFCNESFTGKSGLGIHMLQAHTYMVTTRISAKTRQQLEKPETGSNPVTNRLTPTTEQPSTSSTQTDRSKAKAKPGSKHHCSECSMNFNKGSDFRQHNIEKHNAPASHPCQYCQRGFSTWSYLGQHAFRDHKDQAVSRHNCHYCGEKFWEKSAYNRHLVARHPEKYTGEQYKCNHCDSVFISATKFRQHIIKEHSDKKISESVCDHCGKQFVYLSLLLKHQQNCHLKNIGETTECSAIKKIRGTTKKKTCAGAEKKTRKAAKEKIR